MGRTIALVTTVLVSATFLQGSAQVPTSRSETTLPSALGPLIGSGFSIGMRPSEDVEARLRQHRDMLNRHVTLSIDGATPRHILNRLVRQHGEIYWMVSYARLESADPDAARAIAKNCTLTLGTADDIGLSTSF